MNIMPKAPTWFFVAGLLVEALLAGRRNCQFPENSKEMANNFLQNVNLKGCDHGVRLKKWVREK